VKIRQLTIFSILSVFGGLGSAQAALVGGFDVVSYATSLDAVTPALLAGDIITTGGTLAGVTTDQSVDTYAQLPSTATAGSITLTLGFASNTLVNGALNDLVLFDIGSPDAFTVTINNQTMTALTADTGLKTSANAQLNAAVIDLSSFGVADGAAVSSIDIGLTRGGASFALAGTISSVPVPAAVWLFGSGLLGLAGVARRKR